MSNKLFILLLYRNFVVSEMKKRRPVQPLFT
jgi:hypothetical protein